MARPRQKRETTSATSTRTREASLRKRAASRGYQLERGEDGAWYAVIVGGGTRFGPLATLDDVEEFLP